MSSETEPCPELEAFYAKYGATTRAHKIANLTRELGESNTHFFPPIRNDEDRELMELAILEEQWKVAHQLVTPIYA